MGEGAVPASGFAGAGDRRAALFTARTHAPFRAARRTRGGGIVGVDPARAFAIAHPLGVDALACLGGPRRVALVGAGPYPERARAAGYTGHEACPWRALVGRHGAGRADGDPVLADPAEEAIREAGIDAGDGEGVAARVSSSVALDVRVCAPREKDGERSEAQLGHVPDMSRSRANPNTGGRVPDGATLARSGATEPRCLTSRCLTSRCSRLRADRARAR